MISDVDIEDWDQGYQEAYLKWAEEYGLDYEPYIGHPDVYAAFKAGMKFTKERYEQAIRGNGLASGIKDLFKL